ncbi:CLUMA_CG000158, isoform A [Clunio marinus]|uniref:CLUMA_CG000158, isoform A n=1 Tax=Clunio marinus TaxID=568069 RepID=A0A1J1HFM9_9DIPT|nr:CLUMA_CG000158, isoform A [Clunio marinus]
MSALPKKHGGWADEFKKSASKKNVLENIEKERFLSSASSRDGNIIEIPEIDEIQNLDNISEPPSRTIYNKDLDLDVLKKNPINVDDKTDLSILFEVLESESEIEEPDEIWHWNQLFTNVTAQISNEKQ